MHTCGLFVDAFGDAFLIVWICCVRVSPGWSSPWLLSVSRTTKHFVFVSVLLRNKKCAFHIICTLWFLIEVIPEYNQQNHIDKIYLKGRDYQCWPSRRYNPRKDLDNTSRSFCFPIIAVRYKGEGVNGGQRRPRAVRLEIPSRYPSNSSPLHATSTNSSESSNMKSIFTTCTHLSSYTRRSHDIDEGGSVPEGQVINHEKLFRVWKKIRDFYGKYI